MISSSARGPVYFLAAPGQLNDATRFYVGTVERALAHLGRTLRTVASLSEVPARADVLVIDCKVAFRLRTMRRRARFWLWIQGVVPEEVEWHYHSRAKKILWTAFERATIPRARGILMVSEAMRAHYAQKYGWGGLATFVMPCVNQKLDSAAFGIAGRYGRPRFVYAGSMHVWQCFGLTLEVFRRVRQVLPEASLSVLTGDETAARAAVEAAGLEGVTIGHVPLEELQATLQHYKYGFVLRDEHVVNAVATPTKVSSYMAAGVIPVTTTAVKDYAERLGHLDHIIMSPSRDAQEIADRILAMEGRVLLSEAVAAEYRTAFDTYLSHDNYVGPLASFLRSTGLEAARTGAEIS